MAFDSGDVSKIFCFGWRKSPRNEFGVFAKGYHQAARSLSNILLGKPRFSDYEAYPIVFLFRHALELNLKNIIYKGALLSGFRRMEDNEQDS